MSASLQKHQTQRSTLLSILRTLPKNRPVASRILSYTRNDERLQLSDDLPIETVNRILFDALSAPPPPESHSKELETNHRLLQFLLIHGAQINSPHLTDPYLRTPLIWAVYFKRVHDVKFLLENGASANILSIPHCNPTRGYLDPNYYLEPHATVNTSCLMLGIASGSLEMVKLLLAHGADLSHAMSHASLFHCASKGDLPMVKLLVAHGADVRQIYVDQTYGPCMFWTNMTLSDVLFRESCHTEDRLTSIAYHIVGTRNVDPTTVGKFTSMIVDHQNQIDCLNFLLSKGAPAVSRDELSGAIQFRRFLTLCRVYQFCAANRITIEFPDVFPEIVYSEEPPLISSGLEILAELMTTLPRTKVTASNDFLYVLGVVVREDTFPRLKELCINQIRKSLYLGMLGHRFRENVSALGLPHGLGNMVSMKKLNDRLQSQLLAPMSRHIQPVGNEILW